MIKMRILLHCNRFRCRKKNPLPLKSAPSLFWLYREHLNISLHRENVFSSVKAGVTFTIKSFRLFLKRYTRQ